AGNLRLSRGVQRRPSGPGGGSDDVGFAARHPHRHPAHAAPAPNRRSTMTSRPVASRVVATDRTVHRRYRHGRRLAGGIAGAALGIALLIWTLLPVYNMVLIALDDEGDEFSGSLWPSDPSFNSFRAVLTQDHWYLEHFWHQFGNSIFLGIATM